MSQLSPQWKNLTSLSELNHVINESKYKPVLILKHDPSSGESIRIKNELDLNWGLTSDQVDLYLVESYQQTISKEIVDVAGIDDEFPQIVLFADGVTMYDESYDMISFKKIKLALKIVNRTFRWLETRA
ncbi:MAG: bacillithiol system protein YtxJ [Cyclobacteriaceae bacterium]|jgi:bacillithiol system protein YtxJ